MLHRPAWSVSSSRPLVAIIGQPSRRRRPVRIVNPAGADSAEVPQVEQVQNFQHTLHHWLCSGPHFIHILVGHFLKYDTAVTGASDLVLEIVLKFIQQLLFPHVFAIVVCIG